MATLPSLRQLQYLVALDAQRNFTRAAAACFVTQSTLSAGLKELEATLGAHLVERDRQRVVVTPLGAEVVARARQLLAQAEDLVALAAGAGAPMSGTLRLGVIPTIAPFLLPRVLPGLRAKYPRLRLLLREDLTAQLLARLHDAQLDFALIALPYDTGDLTVKPLFDDEFWLAGPGNDPLFRHKRVAVTGMLSERLLLLEEGHCLREHTLAACPRDTPSNRQGIEATSLLTLVEMVESGVGLALVPEIALKAGLLDRTTLTARPLAPSAPKRTLALVARPTSARTSDLQALADELIETRRQDARGVFTTRGRRAAGASRSARG